jgi:hypothetical protein
MLSTEGGDPALAAGILNFSIHQCRRQQPVVMAPSLRIRQNHAICHSIAQQISIV